MKRQLFLAICLLLLATGFVFSQGRTRDPEQIRKNVDTRNAILNDPQNNPFNKSMEDTVPDVRLLSGGKIPGSETRKYVLMAQAETVVKVLEIADGNTVVVDDGTNNTRVRIICIDAPEAGQPKYEEAKKNLSELLLGKQVVLKYSLNNLKDREGHFLARIFVEGKDVGLEILEKGFAWYNKKDKYFVEKTDDERNFQAENKARNAKLGIWEDLNPQKPWVYKQKAQKDKEKKAEDDE